MIDLQALRHSADRTDTQDAVVSRDWLRQVLHEIEQGRRAQAELSIARGMERAQRVITGG